MGDGGPEGELAESVSPELVLNAPLLPVVPIRGFRINDGRERRYDPISLAGRDAVVVSHVGHPGGGEPLNLVPQEELVKHGSDLQLRGHVLRKCTKPAVGLHRWQMVDRSASGPVLTHVDDVLQGSILNEGDAVNNDLWGYKHSKGAHL